MSDSNRRFWLLLALVVFLLLLFFLKSVITPFLIAAFLAYLGDPLVNYLIRLKFNRTWAATLVFLAIMGIVILLLFIFIPILIRQITVFVNRLPLVLQWVQQTVVPWVQHEFNIDISVDPQGLRNILTAHWQQAGNFIGSAWKIFSQSGLAIFTWFAQLLLVPVVTFYLLRDWDQVVEGIRELLPRRVEPTVVQLVTECDSVLGAFLRGQLFVMLCLVIFYAVGLSIVGLDLALLLGSITGLLSIIPYLGSIVGILMATIAAFLQFHDWLHVSYVIVVFIIGHFVENFILVPWLLGDRIGLHPVAVIFAILAGGHLFGFMGVLLALPVAAIAMVLIRHARQRYLTSELYL